MRQCCSRSNYIIPLIGTEPKILERIVRINGEIENVPNRSFRLVPWSQRGHRCAAKSQRLGRADDPMIFECCLTKTATAARMLLGFWVPNGFPNKQ